MPIYTHCDSPSVERRASQPDPVDVDSGRERLRPMAYAEQLAAVTPSGPAALQAKTTGASSPDLVHEAAHRGTQGGGGPLPHLDQIRASFGAHDVGGVKAHVGGPAREANEAMGAQAFARGNDVAFKSAPDLHTAAHEAAHVVQQRGGVSLKGGVGQAGDRFERHADAVADKVVAGGSAEALLGDVQQAGGRSGAVVQRLNDGSYPSGPTERDRQDELKRRGPQPNRTERDRQDELRRNAYLDQTAAELAARASRELQFEHTPEVEATIRDLVERNGPYDSMLVLGIHLEREQGRRLHPRVSKPRWDLTTYNAKYWENPFHLPTSDKVDSATRLPLLEQYLRNLCRMNRRKQIYRFLVAQQGWEVLGKRMGSTFAPWLKVYRDHLVLDIVRRYNAKPTGTAAGFTSDYDIDFELTGDEKTDPANQRTGPNRRIWAARHRYRTLFGAKFGFAFDICFQLPAEYAHTYTEVEDKGVRERQSNLLNLMSIALNLDRMDPKDAKRTLSLLGLPSSYMVKLRTRMEETLARNLGKPKGKRRKKELFYRYHWDRVFREYQAEKLKCEGTAESRQLQKLGFLLSTIQLKLADFEEEQYAPPDAVAMTVTGPKRARERARRGETGTYPEFMLLPGATAALVEDWKNFQHQKQVAKKWQFTLTRKHSSLNPLQRDLRAGLRYNLFKYAHRALKLLVFVQKDKVRDADGEAIPLNSMTMWQTSSRELDSWLKTTYRIYKGKSNRQIYDNLRAKGDDVLFGFSTLVLAFDVERLELILQRMLCFFGDALTSMLDVEPTRTSLGPIGAIEGPTSQMRRLAEKEDVEGSPSLL